jgi:hypothetical protein
MTDGIGALYTCPKCDTKPFRQVPRFGKHLKEVHNVDIFIHHCSWPDCSHSAVSTKRLAEHVNKAHPKLDAEYFYCSQCSYKAVNKFALTSHQLHHHSKVVKSSFRLSRLVHKSVITNPNMPALVPKLLSTHHVFLEGSIAI